MGSCIQPLGRRTGFRRNLSSHPGWGWGRVSSTVGNRNCNSWVSPHIISTLILRFVKKLLLCLFTDRDVLRQSAQVTHPGSHSWHPWAKPSDNGGSTTPGSFSWRVTYYLCCFTAGLYSGVSDSRKGKKGKWRWREFPLQGWPQ